MRSGCLMLAVSTAFTAVGLQDTCASEVLFDFESAGEIAQIDAKVFSEAYAKVCELIKDEPKTLGAITKIIKTLFEESDCQQNAPLVYQILYALNKQGLLKVEEVRLPGAFEHLDTPEFRISLK